MEIVLALHTYPLRGICSARMLGMKDFICFLRSSTSMVLLFYLYVFYLLGCCICDIANTFFLKKESLAADVPLLILDSSFIYYHYHFDYLLSLFDLFKCIISCLLSVQNPLFAILNLRIDLNHTGEEVKPGTKVSCKADEGYVIHLSQVYRLHC
jgi:hypothetical protein